MSKKSKTLNVKCKIEGCERNAMYIKDCVCQMHYFRFMRTGSYELPPKPVRKEKTHNAKGYQMLFMPEHPLAMKNGYVYEHRYVMYQHIGEDLGICEFCGCSLDWKNCHVDHTDNDIKNNNLDNLRVICRGCNVMRSHRNIPKHTHKGHLGITFNGITMTATEWARYEGVNVSHVTIKRRLKNGWSVERALFTPSATHPNKKSKVRQTKYKNNFEVNAKGVELD